jgi:hypothetical protein
MEGISQKLADEIKIGLSAAICCYIKEDKTEVLKRVDRIIQSYVMHEK